MILNVLTVVLTANVIDGMVMVMEMSMVMVMVMEMSMVMVMVMVSPRFWHAH